MLRAANLKSLVAKLARWLIWLQLLLAGLPQPGQSAPGQLNSSQVNLDEPPLERPAGSRADQAEPVARLHYHFERQMDPFMQLHKFNSTNFRGNTLTCNDGSPTGYYKRLNKHSRSWIIYLQGGGFCASDEACQQRWRRSPHLMSSNFWQASKSVDGILSSEPRDNPFLWNANHIYVPYCSSDSWSGASQMASASEQSQHHDRRPRSQRNQRQQFVFMGAQILERIFESLFDELPHEFSLYEAKFILLAGDSAGATGVMLNLDKLNKLVQLKFAALRSAESRGAGAWRPLAAGPVVRGLADSGWFLDNEPYDFMDQYSSANNNNNNYQPTPPFATRQAQHNQASPVRYLNPNSHSQPVAAAAPMQYFEEADASQANQASQWQPPQQQQPVVDCDRQRCNPLQSIRQAMLHWNGQVPASCAQRHSLEPWRCYFGYRLYQSLKTPLFVVQWLYDEAQLIVDNIGRPDTVGQWNYVNRLVNDLRGSLENVTALFAPSCFSHSLIIKQTWNQINIDGFKLPHILNSWEEETLARQPTIESLLATENHAPTSDLSTISNNNNNQQQQQTTPATMSGLAFRSTNQQQIEHRQDGPTSSSSSSSSSTSRITTPSRRSRKRKRNNQQQKHSPAAGQQHFLAQSNRLGRSTAMSVDSDLTPMLNNNVPDILSMASVSQRHPQDSSEKFRLIDSCGWPQCNRDCPTSDQDLNSPPFPPRR